MTPTELPLRYISTTCELIAYSDCMVSTFPICFESFVFFRRRRRTRHLSLSLSLRRWLSFTTFAFGSWSCDFRVSCCVGNERGRERDLLLVCTELHLCIWVLNTMKTIDTMVGPIHIPFIGWVWLNMDHWSGSLMHLPHKNVIPFDEETGSLN